MATNPPRRTAVSADGAGFWKLRNQQVRGSPTPTPTQWLDISSRTHRLCNCEVELRGDSVGLGNSLRPWACNGPCYSAWRRRRGRRGSDVCDQRGWIQHQAVSSSGHFHPPFTRGLFGTLALSLCLRGCAAARVRLRSKRHTLGSP